MKNYVKMSLMVLTFGLFAVAMTSCGKEACIECGAFGVKQTFCEGENYNGQTLTEDNIDDIIAVSGGFCSRK